MYIVYAGWFLFLKGMLKQALGGHAKEKDDTQVEDRRVETVEKKGEVINDEADETALEGVDSTNNSDLPNTKGAVVPESEDPNQIADADVVESLIEEKPRVMD